MRFPHARRRGSRSALLALGVAVCFGVLTGCTGKDGASEGLPTSTPEELPTSICPSCGPSTGGETGDFPGTPRSCEPLLSSIEVDDEEARSLGYDVAKIRRQLPHSIDVPMVWGKAPRPSVSYEDAQFETEPASGYALHETQISLRFHVSPMFMYERIDPKYCDGTTCSNGAISVPQRGCEALHVDMEVEVQTADDAIRGTLKGRASDRGLGDVYIWVSADLAKVSGKLRLSPKMDLGPITGTLALAVRLEGDSTMGTLTPSIRFDTTIDESVYTRMYMPIMGQFRVGTREAPAVPSITGMLGGGAGSDGRKQ